MRLLQQLTPIPPLEFQDFIIDRQRHLVIRNDREIHLTSKAFLTLVLLAEHPGWVLTKKQIYEAVWEEEFHDQEHTVENTIWMIRKALGFNENNSNYIETVIGGGYRFRVK